MPRPGRFKTSRVDLMQLVISDGYTGRRPSVKSAVQIARAALLASLLVLVL